jgi:FixJ family two-component response regulator
MPRKTVIAIVDDDQSVREALSALMRSLGYRVGVFCSAEGFLKSALSGHADCLIADVQMPGMTGLELYDQLVASGRPIPTILITAYPREEVRARALDAGIIAYLTKPFTKDDLLACIQSALAEKR